MKFTYDPRSNVGYIRFKKKKGDAESIKLSDELVIDLAPDGTVYGIELLNATEQLSRDDTQELLVINEETGEFAGLSIDKHKKKRTSKSSAKTTRSKKK